MSVRTLPKDKHCFCNWFVEGQLQGDNFSVGQLVPAPNGEKFKAPPRKKPRKSRFDL